MRYLVVIKILPAFAFLWACGTHHKVPLNSSPAGKPADSGLSELNDNIAIAGQKGIGKREGKNFVKTFTVDNRRAVTESVSHSLKTETAIIQTIASQSLSRKEETFTQNSTTNGELYQLSSVPSNGQIETAFVNGVEAANGECIYHAPSNGAYFHNRTITKGSTVKVVYLGTASIQPSYVFSTDTSAVGVSVSEVATGASVSASFEGNVTFVPNSLAAGISLNVKYYLPNQSLVQGTLKNEPLTDTLKIDLPECANAPATVNGKIFTVKCAVTNKSVIPVNYSFADAALQKFSMAEVEHPDLGEWEIKIAGNVTKAYRRQGTWIYIDTVIPLGSKVEIAHRTP